MNKDTNAINWFEIPAADISRAKAFYENIFGIEMESMDMMGMEMAMFPADNGNGKVSGALVKGDMNTPSADGVVIYLNANPNMDTVIEKIEGAGGSIALPKTLIAEGMGYMAFFMDTEGNKMGLHSQE